MSFKDLIIEEYERLDEDDLINAGIALDDEDAAWEFAMQRVQDRIHDTADMLYKRSKE